MQVLCKFYVYLNSENDKVNPFLLGTFFSGTLLPGNIYFCDCGGAKSCEANGIAVQRRYARKNSRLHQPPLSVLTAWQDSMGRLVWSRICSPSAPNPGMSRSSSLIWFGRWITLKENTYNLMVSYFFFFISHIFNQVAKFRYKIYQWFHHVDLMSSIRCKWWRQCFFKNGFCWNSQGIFTLT